MVAVAATNRRTHSLDVTLGQRDDFTIELHCPGKRCRQRFIGESNGSVARGVCPSCGGEIVFRTKEARDNDLTIPRAGSNVHSSQS